MVPIAAGHEVGQWTLMGQTTRHAAVILLAAALAVQVIDATGEMNAVDAVGLTEIEIPDAGLIPSRLRLPDVCVSVSRILIVCGQVDTIRATTLAGRGRLRHLLAMAQRHH